MTICYLFMTKLQLILNFLQLIAFSPYWHKGCQETKQTDVPYV